MYIITGSYAPNYRLWVAIDEDIRMHSYMKEMSIWGGSDKRETFHGIEYLGYELKSIDQAAESMKHLETMRAKINKEAQEAYDRRRYRIVDMWEEAKTHDSYPLFGVNHGEFAPGQFVTTYEGKADEDLLRLVVATFTQFFTLEWTSKPFEMCISPRFVYFRHQK